ncbi:hypothetical protein [Trichocoleus sp. FACHB-832]|nr:hypothetical protein [Trichocoleus sp. FACHB-832]
MSENKPKQQSQKVGSEPQKKSAPAHPPATPPEQRTQSRNDGKDS